MTTKRTMVCDECGKSLNDSNWYIEVAGNLNLSNPASRSSTMPRFWLEVRHFCDSTCLEGWVGALDPEK